MTQPLRALAALALALVQVREHLAEGLALARLGEAPELPLAEGLVLTLVLPCVACVQLMRVAGLPPAHVLLQLVEH